MAWYLFEGSLTPEAWGDLVKNPQDRREALKPLMDAIGGSIEHYFFALGENDVYILYQAPDNKAVASAMMAVLTGGAINSGKTIALMTMEDAMDAMRTAGDLTYQPPSGD
jgi:uncharacterized protein with GYD domain